MGIWFSGYFQNPRPRVYGNRVPQRDAATLLPLINAHVAPDTIVHSDEWAAYSLIEFKGSPMFPHMMLLTIWLTLLNHATGVHTQNVESYWNRVKTKLKRMKGCHGHQLPRYLDEFIWRERYGTSTFLALQNIMRDIAVHYPV